MKGSKNTFTKREANQEFDHQSEVVRMFSGLGFTNVKVNSCFTNGASHYAHVNLDVIEQGELPMELFVFEGITSVKVRVSDHASNLERFGGVAGNQVSFKILKGLIENGVVKPRNIN